MSVDFFKTNCKEEIQSVELFGLCDDQNGKKAYSDIDNTENWIATIKNSNAKEIIFTPIDNCITIFKKGTKDKESTCDGMLTFQDSLYLVELKERITGGWVSEAINQLKNTIMLISANHDLTMFKYKKAFGCNKKHPHFTTIDNELSKKFFNESNGFRIDVQSEIVIN